MITVQVRNENMVDAIPSNFINIHLYLSALTAIDEEKLVAHGDYLRSGMPVMCRQRRVISQDSYSKHYTNLIFVLCGYCNLSQFQDFTKTLPIKEPAGLNFFLYFEKNLFEFSLCRDRYP